MRSDLIGRVRKLSMLRSESHPWSTLDDDELLKSAGLYIHDFSTGKSGYTLAAALLFGRDDVIRSILPYYKTDALLRRFDHDRYDDRDDIRTNLIDSYG